MNNKTILVFDDDTNILDVFTIVLEASGYHVEISETSHNILERVKEVSPDMIIMDNWIPNIGGVKATQILKSEPAFKHIRFKCFEASLRRYSPIHPNQMVLLGRHPLRPALQVNLHRC